MMTLLSAADLLAELLGFDNVYAGNLDENKEKAIGVFLLKEQKKRLCLGGKAQTGFFYKDISIIVHWTDNPSAAEQKANEIFEVLSDIRDIQSGEYTVKFTQSRLPFFIGKDEKGVCEYAIETTLIYQRKD